VLRYGSVRPHQAPDLVQGAIFARSGVVPSHTAIFVGGSDLHLAEEILTAVQAAFVDGQRVSIMLDASGCNTTAAAAVARLTSAGDLVGQRVVVLAGTGPVGQRAAGLLARAGANVTLTSRRRAAAEGACHAIYTRFGAPSTPAEITTADDLVRILEGACAVLAAGPPGIQLLPERIWQQRAGLRLLADLNAVPRLGIEGMQVTWNGEERDGRLLFGAEGIGKLKTKLHRTCLCRLFLRNDLILDAEEILGMATEIEGQCTS
jgi:hypothetical protein